MGRIWVTLSHAADWEQTQTDKISQCLAFWKLGVSPSLRQDAPEMIDADVCLTSRVLRQAAPASTMGLTTWMSSWIFSQLPVGYLRSRECDAY